MTAVQSDGATTPNMLKRKADVWAEVHAAKTVCPLCGKRLSFRSLRWKHICGRRSVVQVMLDADAAEQRRKDLERKAMESLSARLRERRGEPAVSG